MSTDSQDRSIAELTRQLSDQATRLAQQEVEPAKAELSIKGRKIGMGAGAFGGAAVVGILALGALVATVPRQTIDTVKEDVREAKTRAKEGRA